MSKQPQCSGPSAYTSLTAPRGNCPDRPTYSVSFGVRARYACDRHLGWVVLMLQPEPGSCFLLRQLTAEVRGDVVDE